MRGKGGVGQTFQSAGFPGFPARSFGPGDWKVARTGRLESLPYIYAAEALWLSYARIPAASDNTDLFS